MKEYKIPADVKATAAALLEHVPAYAQVKQVIALLDELPEVEEKTKKKQRKNLNTNSKDKEATDGKFF